MILRVMCAVAFAAGFAAGALGAPLAYVPNKVAFVCICDPPSLAVCQVVR